MKKLISKNINKKSPSGDWDIHTLLNGKNRITVILIKINRVKIIHNTNTTTMNLIILRTNLLDGLSSVERAVGENTNLPILKIF